MGAERTNIFLIGVEETAEAYLRYDHEFSSDEILQSPLPQGQSFVFRTIKELYTFSIVTVTICCHPKRNYRRPYSSCPSYQPEIFHGAVTNMRRCKCHPASEITAMQLWGSDLETMVYRLIGYPKLPKGRMESFLQRAFH